MVKKNFKNNPDSYPSATGPLRLPTYDEPLVSLKWELQWCPNGTVGSQTPELKSYSHFLSYVLEQLCNLSTPQFLHLQMG